KDIGEGWLSTVRAAVSGRSKSVGLERLAIACTGAVARVVYSRTFPCLTMPQTGRLNKSPHTAHAIEIRTKMSWLLTLRLCRLKVAEFPSRSAADFPQESPPQKSVAHNSGFRRPAGQKASRYFPVASKS